MAILAGACEDNNPGTPDLGVVSDAGVPPGSGDLGSGTANPFARIVLGRMYEQQQFTLHSAGSPTPTETAQSIGQALGSLKPTWVSGLIYSRSDTMLTDQMISDYNTVRSLVRQASPQCRFDFAFSLNPKQPVPFADGNALVAKMTAVDTALHPDIWFFDFYDTVQKTDPAMIQAAINYAHSHGQLVGGNIFSGNMTYPPGSDFVAVDDTTTSVDGGMASFSLNRSQIQALDATGVPVVAHLNSNPQNGPTTESCVFIQSWNEQMREQYVTQQAENQATWGYKLMYGVFYPLCPGAVSYDALRDQSAAAGGGTMLDAIARMMSMFNP